MGSQTKHNLRGRPLIFFATFNCSVLHFLILENLFPRLPSLLKLFVEFNTYFQWGNEHKNNPTDNTFPCETLFSQSKQNICLSQVISRKRYIVFFRCKTTGHKVVALGCDCIFTFVNYTVHECTNNKTLCICNRTTCSPIWKWLDGKKFLGQPKLDKAEGRLTSDIGRLKSDIWHQTTHMRGLTSDVWLQTTNILCLTWDMRRLISIIRHHRSNIRHQRPDIRQQTSVVWHQTSEFRDLTWDIRCLTSDFCHKISEIRRLT